MTTTSTDTVAPKAGRWYMTRCGAVALVVLVYPNTGRASGLKLWSRNFYDDIWWDTTGAVLDQRPGAPSDLVRELDGPPEWSGWTTGGSDAK